MNTTWILLLIAVISGVFYFFRKKSIPKDAEMVALHTAEDNFLEPIISYSVYTVDAILNHRYLNYTHKDFPNHVGILKGQYIEIDWNVINADLITINGVGLVKAVGRKAFYPKENTAFIITAKNREYEIQQKIYVRIFPQKVTDKLFTKQPAIRIQSQLTTKTPELTKPPVITIENPILTIKKPGIENLHEVLQDKIVAKTFSQKVKEFISVNQPDKKNNQDGRI